MTDRITRAMVTGASSGLGEDLARQLAAHGVELVLVARRESRLRTLADSLPVATEVIVADLADPADLDRVAARLAAASEPVDLLVNNAGLGAYGDLVALDDTVHGTMLAVNVAALTHLTRAVLPQLLDRGTGGVINVGSTAGYQPGPYNAVYAATKAYVRSFTEAVHEEVRARGVHVMLLAPGFVATEFQEVAGMRTGRVAEVGTMSSAEVVTEALEAYAAGRVVCVPGLANRATAFGSRYAPPAVVRRVASRVYRGLAVR